jgi:hypothetical protein
MATIIANFDSATDKHNLRLIFNEVEARMSQFAIFIVFVALQSTASLIIQIHETIQIEN